MVIGILKDIRTKLGKAVGEKVLVTLELDDIPRDVEVPDDLARALAAAGLTDAFAQLSSTRRREVAGSVASAKKPDTRQRRIDAAVQELGGST